MLNPGQFLHALDFESIRTKIMQDRADERKCKFIQLIQKDTKGQLFIEIIFLVQIILQCNTVKIF